jgi:hypothetical protein
MLAGLIVFSALSCAQLLSNPNVSAKGQAVFRPPFLLKLRIDNDHFYEEKFQAIPYVADNGVYLFSGESFGINCVMRQNQISGVVYQPNLSKADITFDFKQEHSQNKPMMLLVIRNTLKRRIKLDALMTVPGDKDVHQTDVLPVEPGHSNTESWPHPIVQLLLKNFRFSKSGVQ